MSTAPLFSIRVLDASRVLAGPFCGQLLADLGAEVIKVERPGQGDETRAWGPPFAGALSAYFLSCNRNKKALTLDLAKPEGLDIFGRLISRSDVLLENFRSATAEKLGLSPERLLAQNPRLVVCSISGFGRTGPWSDLPGYDFAIQGLSGLMSITGPIEGPPCKVGVAVTDVFTGLYAATAVLACLHARAQSGHGYAIDLALLDCAVAAQVNLVQAFLTSGEVPARQGNAHLQIVPYQAFATADDWLVLRTTRQTIRDFHDQYDLGDIDLPVREWRLLLPGGTDAAPKLCVYDGELRLRMELAADLSRGYTTRAGVERPTAGVRVTPPG